MLWGMGGLWAGVEEPTWSPDWPLYLLVASAGVATFQFGEDHNETTAVTVGSIPYILNFLEYEVVAVNNHDIPPGLMALLLSGRKTSLQRVTECLTRSAQQHSEVVRFWLVWPKTVSANQASSSLNPSLHHFTLTSSPSSSTHIYNISTYSESEHCSFAFADTRPY